MIVRNPAPRVVVCYLCGTAEAQTRDHVPPKALFPEPRPSNLLTLAACQSCNVDYAEDEEYFRTNFCVAYSPVNDVAVRPVFEKFRRAYRRKPQKLYELRQRIKEPVWIKNPSGLIVGRAQQFVFSKDRTERVFRKIAFGLHYHHTGIRPITPEEPTVVFYGNKEIMTPGLLTPDHLAYSVWQLAQHHKAWDPVFRYHGYVSPNGDGAIWWLRLYMVHLAIVLFEFHRSD